MNLNLPSFPKIRPQYLSLTAVVTSLLIIIFAALPAQIKSESLISYSLGQDIKIELSGLLKKDSVEVISNFDTPLKANLATSSFNKNTLTISPQDLFYPTTEYTLVVKTKNFFGLPTSKEFRFTTSSLPQVISAGNLEQKEKMKVTTTFEFKINQEIPSNFYQFSSKPDFQFSQTSDKDKLIVKPVGKLKHGQNYTLRLGLKSKTLGNLEIYDDKVTTLDPLKLVSLKTNNGLKTVLKDDNLTLTFNKEVDQMSAENLITTTPTTKLVFKWSNKKSVKISANTSWKTNTNYLLNINDQVTALDSAQLDTAKQIKFKTAGAIKALSLTPSGAYISTTPTISIKFDQPVDKTSAQNNFTINPSVNGSFSWSGKTMNFKPIGLGLLKTYTVSLAKGVKTIGGENSKQDFSTSFTTTSERVKVIGYSVNGQPITAYYFGKGAKKILLVGSLHGSESNTGSMLGQWISYLRSNQTAIKSDRTFIIVPYSNPDGVATGNRFNARGVDLNRNWGTSDWQALTYWQNRSYPHGGGSSAFSEPEVQALRSLINSVSPKRIITYHSAANLVLGDGVAQSFGNWYASKTGYNRSYTESEHDDGDGESALGYVITGSMEEWITDSRSIPTLVVEFISAFDSEYNRNFPALYGLLTYKL